MSGPMKIRVQIKGKFCHPWNEASKFTHENPWLEDEISWQKAYFHRLFAVSFREGISLYFLKSWAIFWRCQIQLAPKKTRSEFLRDKNKPQQMKLQFLFISYLQVVINSGIFIMHVFSNTANLCKFHPLFQERTVAIWRNLISTSTTFESPW